MAASEVYLVFPKEFGAKTGMTVSNKYQIQLKKKKKNPEAATVGVL